MKTYKKLVFILLLTCLFNGHVISQESLAVFGKVTEEELNMKVYEKDQTAEAVILSDLGKAYFNQNTSGSFDLVFERTVKIKILSKAGIKWAEVEIPFYQDKNQKEIIEYINAYTASFEDNRIRKSNVYPENIYEEKATEHWYVKKFAFPNVQVGSVIEYNFKIISPFKFNMRDWEFQNRIPVVYSEYEVRMNPFYEYTFLLQGRDSFDENTSHRDQNSRQYGTIEYYDMISKFIMRDLPAFNDETYITSINDHIIKLDFQLSKITRTDGVSIDVFTSWPTVCNELLKYNDFGKYMSSIKGTAKKIVEELTLDDLSPEGKIKVIVDYVKSNFTWNGYKSKYASKKAKEFISEKTGNCAEINLYVVTLLNEAGIEAYPVLISTRDHGKIIVDYPFVQFFNYTIAMARLDFDKILIDGSEAMSTYNEIPPRCFNNKGLVVYKKSEEWVDLVPSKPSLRKYDFDIDLTSNHESVISTGTIKYDGIDAISFRRKYSNNEKLEKYITDMGFAHVEAVSSPNLTDRNLPLVLQFLRIH